MTAPAEAPTRLMASSTPRAMPRDGSSGVEATFHTSTRPVASSNRQTSVNVPPESTPIRHVMRSLPVLPFAETAGRRLAAHHRRTGTEIPAAGKAGGGDADSTGWCERYLTTTHGP